MVGMKYLFLEQRAPAGAEENEVTLVFEGARTGMASWLADAGSGGAAEYLPADSLLAGYVSMREPMAAVPGIHRADDEGRDSPSTANMAAGGRETRRGLHREPDRGAGNRGGLRAERVLRQRSDVGDGRVWRTTRRSSTARSRSSWTRSTRSLRADEQDKRIVFGQESAGGRVWNTIKAGGLPFGVTWTYDRGYMVAASDRASAERAIATRNGGSPLVWSPEFLGQLPSSAGHPPVRVRLAEHEGGARVVLGAGPEPGADQAARRARPGARRVRRNAGPDPRRQPDSSIGSDPGRHAAREPEPGA